MWDGKEGLPLPTSVTKGISVRPLAWWRGKWMGRDLWAGDRVDARADTEQQFPVTLHPHILPAGRGQAPAPVAGLQKQEVLAEAGGRLRQTENREGTGSQSLSLGQSLGVIRTPGSACPDRQPQPPPPGIFHSLEEEELCLLGQGEAGRRGKYLRYESIGFFKRLSLNSGGI